jgi:tripartite-type tricarboxylate transporter receptor subunit TctC
MRKLIKLLLGVSFSLNVAYADTCKMVIDYPPGGALDSQARLMMKANPNIKTLDYKIGGISTLAIRHLEENKEYMFFGSPSAFGDKSPIKDPPIELVKIVLSAPLYAITNKKITWEQLIKEKINLGIPGIGTSHHVLALQLKDINPEINIVPTGGDAKALPLIVNKDLDVYLVSSTNGFNWTNHFNFDTIFIISLGENFKRGSVSLTSVAFNGIFVHKDASPEQKKNIIKCVEDAVTTKVYQDTLLSLKVTPLNIDGKEKDRLFNQYVNFMKKYGL